MPTNRPILTEMGNPQKLYRPSVPEAVRILIGLGLVELINLTTHNDVLTIVALGVISGGYLVWYSVRNWRSKGWI
jgi:hypothetical protein